MLSNKEDFQQRLQAIFQTATDGIIIIDRTGVIQQVNYAVTNLFQYTSDELIGRKINMLMDQHDRTHHDEYMSAYQRTGHRKIIGIGREVTGRRKDGTLFPIRLAVSEVKQGEGTFYTGILHDLSEFKKAQEHIRQLNEQLQQKVDERTKELNEAVNQLLQTNKQMRSEIVWRESIEATLRERERQLEEALTKEKELGELKTRFVSMASHEFRTPLATILSSASILEKYTESEQQLKRLKHIDRIKAQVRNMNGILSDFLSLSKLESGSVEVHLEDIDIHELIREIQSEMSGQLRGSQEFVVTSSLEGSAFMTDPRILKNVLYNVVSNAIKYSHDDGEIKVDIYQEDVNLVIAVSDQGIGIPQEDQRHLFTRFFRAANAINIQGTGLGLNIVMRYLNLLNGSISFDSKEGTGTTFFLKFPI